MTTVEALKGTNLVTGKDQFVVRITTSRGSHTISVGEKTYESVTAITESKEIPTVKEAPKQK